MLKDRKYIMLDNLGLSEEDRNNILEAYDKIMQVQGEEEQKRLKEKESFDKELLDLKKKYKID